MYEFLINTNHNYKIHWSQFKLKLYFVISETKEESEYTFCLVCEACERILTSFVDHAKNEIIKQR